MKALDAEQPIDTQRLLVLTPDNHIPGVVANTEDDRVAWSSFEDLVTAIEEAIEVDEEWLASERNLPTERERELLRELVRFLISEGLGGKAVDEVLVVAARRALSEYLNYSAYICQPNRSFRPSSHMAFYANGRIHHQIPKILGKIEQITMTRNALSRYSGDKEHWERLLFIFDELEKSADSRIGELVKVLFLSTPEDGMTITLPNDIENNLASDTGRTIAFTQGQRYVPLERLKKAPRKTSELLKA